MDGEATKTIVLNIVDDDVVEPHIETVRVALSVLPGAFGASVGRLSEATVRIFDYMDGVDIFSDSFGLDSGSTNNTMGWTVVGNGANPAWIDSNGLYSVDQLFGENEYNPACDYAAKSPCGHLPKWRQLWRRKRQWDRIC